MRPKWIGPYTIIKSLGKGRVMLQNRNGKILGKSYHASNLKLYKRLSNAALQSQDVDDSQSRDENVSQVENELQFQEIETSSPVQDTHTFSQDVNTLIQDVDTTMQDVDTPIQDVDMPILDVDNVNQDVVSPIQDVENSHSQEDNGISPSENVPSGEVAYIKTVEIKTCNSKRFQPPLYKTRTKMAKKLGLKSVSKVTFGRVGELK